jgi:hypothetical protein
MPHTPLLLLLLLSLLHFLPCQLVGAEFTLRPTKGAADIESSFPENMEHVGVGTSFNYLSRPLQPLRIVVANRATSNFIEMAAAAFTASERNFKVDFTEVPLAPDAKKAFFEEGETKNKKEENKKNKKRKKLLVALGA